MSSHPGLLLTGCLTSGRSLSPPVWALSFATLGLPPALVTYQLSSGLDEMTDGALPTLVESTVQIKDWQV